MEQNSWDLALKGNLNSVILGRLDQRHHRENYLFQLCKNALQGEIGRVMRKERELLMSHREECGTRDGYDVSQTMRRR